MFCQIFAKLLFCTALCWEMSVLISSKKDFSSAFLSGSVKSILEFLGGEVGWSCWSLGPYTLCPPFVLSGSGSGGDFRSGELEGEIVAFLDLVIRGDGLGWVGVK